MSSFLVSKRCIDVIITYVFFGQNHLKYMPFCDAGFDDDQTKAGQELWDLNNAATNYRYQDKGPTTEAPMYAFKRTHATLPEVYKSIQAYLYQCNEGQFDEKELFKKIVRLQHYVSDRIISAFPEYEKAPWG